jgi:chemotaxis protein methyltransferase CheR
MTEQEFDRLGRFIQDGYGIKMPDTKKLMLESRLNKRLKALQIDSFGDYIEHVFDHGKNYEIVHMIDLVTTNKTDFFREPDHFDLLRERVLPEFVKTREQVFDLRAWSAGCSTGEEPYTLAMVLSEFAESHRRFSFDILATDVSTQVLEHARTAIYQESKILPVPESLKKKYIRRSTEREKMQVRMSPALRSRVNFFRLNLMDERFTEVGKLDTIFCRNVLIYFDRDIQEKLIQHFCQHLKPGGYLFIGHSETLFSIDAPLRQVVPTVYRRI